MLRLLRKLQRTQKALLIIICAIMVLCLIIVFGLPRESLPTRDAANPFGAASEEVVAEVAGYDILGRELQRALNAISSQGGQNLQFISAYSDTLLDQLIEQRVKMIEADRLGLTITDDEVRLQIARRYPGFLDERGRFLPYADYRRRLEVGGVTIDEFEGNERQLLLDQKLRTYVTDGISVSSQEVEQNYVRQNSSLDLAYVLIDPADFRDQVDVTDAEAQSHFQAHGEDFKIDEPERKVDYLFLAYDPLKKKVKVTDDELGKEYEQTKNQQTVGAWVSQIVFPFNETNEAQTRQQADEVVKAARGDDTTPAVDFAELGGKEIGYVEKKTGDSSHQQRVFYLSDAQQDVTEPIRQDNAFYVLKANRWKRKSLAQARSELRARIRDRKARTEASKLANEIKQKLTETKDIKKVAEEFQQRLGNPPLDQIVRRTGFFASSDQLPEFGAYSASFTTAAASLDEIGEVGNQVFLKDGLAIPQLAAKREPNDEPAFEQVKDRVIARLRDEKTAQRARQYAEKLIARAPTVKKLERAARREDLKWQTQENFKRGTILSGLSRSEQLEGFAFQAEAGQVVPQVIKLGEKFIVLGVKKKTQADLTKLAEEFDTQRDQLLNQRRFQFYQAYLDKIKDQLAAEGRIIVYKQVFNKITAFRGGNLQNLNITPGQP